MYISEEWRSIFNCLDGIMKVIVNADDFGASESVNDAVDYAFRKGIINRTTIMVTSPCCEDAMRRAFNGNYAGSVGLHLHLDGGGKSL